MHMPLSLNILARLIVGSTLAAWVAFIAVDATMREKAPALALMMWPSDGLAAANLARQNFSKQTVGKANALAEIPDAATLALSKRALATEPLATDAITLIALATPSADDRFRLLRASLRLDRRNALTQTHLLAEYARLEMASEAILTMGQMIKVHPEYQGAFVTALVGALADPNNEGAVADILKAEPALGNAVLTGASGVDAAVRSAARIRVNLPRASRGDLQTDRAILGGLARVGDFKAMFRLYALFRKAGTAQIPGQQIGEAPDDYPTVDYPPVDWAFGDNGRISAAWQPGDSKAMKVTVPAGSSGELAHRIVRLPPGTYKLQSTTSELSANALKFELSAKFECVEPNVLFSASELQIIPRSLSNSTIVIPPASCEYFQITLYGSSIDSGSDVELLLRRLTMVAVPGQGAMNGLEIL